MKADITFKPTKKHPVTPILSITPWFHKKKLLFNNNAVSNYYEDKTKTYIPVLWEKTEDGLYLQHNRKPNELFKNYSIKLRYTN